MSKKKTRAYALTLARGEVGVKESPSGSNRVKYWDWYKQQTGSDYNGEPWCACFASYILTKCGIKTTHIGCAAWVAALKKSGKFKTSDPQPGDIVFFGSGGSQHVGIVDYVYADGTLKTVEGNTSVTSNDNGGAVMVRKRDPKSTSFPVYGYGDPGYNSPTFGKYKLASKMAMYSKPKTASLKKRTDAKGTSVNLRKFYVDGSGVMWGKRKKTWFKVQSRGGTWRVV